MPKVKRFPNSTSAAVYLSYTLGGLFDEPESASVIASDVRASDFSLERLQERKIASLRYEFLLKHFKQI